MLAKRIHNALVEIANKAYPDVNHFRFWIVFQNRELKSKYGDWGLENPSRAVIRIFRLSEDTKLILQVCIHELAHNTEYSLYKKTGHKKRFYEVYKKLLEASFEMGFLTYDDVRNDTDTAKIIKHHGPLKFSNTNQEHKNTIIKVKNAYSIKEELRARGYGYNGIERTWDFEIKNEVLNDEIEFLKTITSHDNIILCKGFDKSIDAVGYISVGKCFSYKDALKADGYKFNGYGIGNNVWVKKIVMNQKSIELKKLQNMEGIEVRVHS